MAFLKDVGYRQKVAALVNRTILEREGCPSGKRKEREREGKYIEIKNMYWRGEKELGRI